MAARTTPPFRADHVGSLLRPPALLRAREDAAAGRITPDELRAVEDEAIRDAVRLQLDVGLQAVTDGELRRTSWHMDFIYGLDGISTADDKVTISFHNEHGQEPSVTVRLTGADTTPVFRLSSVARLRIESGQVAIGSVISAVGLGSSVEPDWTAMEASLT